MSIFNPFLIKFQKLITQVCSFVPEPPSVMVSNTILSLLEEENREQPDKLEKVHQLRCFLVNHAFIVDPRTEEDYLMAVLRNAKFDVKKAVKKLENYLHASHQLDRYFAWHDDLMTISYQMLCEGIVVLLKKKDALGRTVIIVELAKRDTNKYAVSDLIRTVFLISNIVISIDSDASLAGFVFVWNGAGTGLRHVPSLRELHCMAKCSGVAVISIKKNVMFKCQAFLAASVKVVKSFLSAKMKERFDVIDDNESLYDILQTKAILPQNYGGDESTEDLFEAVRFKWNSVDGQQVAEEMRKFQIDYDKFNNSKEIR